MHFSWTPTTIALFVLLGGVAIFLAWRTIAAILRSKDSDPTHLRKRVFIPLLVLIIIIALFQLCSIFLRR